MRNRHLISRSSSPTRYWVSDHTVNAFTLIEMLIVVAVLGILMSLMGVTMMSGITTAKISATKGTLTKVQGLIQQRVEALQRRPLDKVLVGSYMSLAKGNPKRAESFAWKVIFRQAFPQSWTEASRWSSQVLSATSEAVPGTTTPATESAEVLYFILTKSNAFGFPPEGADVFDSSEVKDTNNNGKLELVDGWGKPLRFYRWPTRLVRGGPAATPLTAASVSSVAKALISTTPASTVELNHDSDDKYGLLTLDSLSKAGINATDFEAGTGVFSQFGAFHTASTYSVPMVMSVGPDGESGLYEPTDFSTGGSGTFGYLANPNPDATISQQAFDNLSNLNTRAGGTR